MKAVKLREQVIAASLCAGLLLGGGLWVKVAQVRREERRGVWLSYVRGPLALYVQGSTQGAALTGRLKKLTPGQRVQLGNAVQSLRESWTQTVGQQPDFEADAYFSDLDQCVPWHSAISHLAESWPRLDFRNKDELANARLAALGFQRNLSLRVGHQWEKLKNDLTWSREEINESQAAVDALKAPLPY